MSSTTLTSEEQRTEDVDEVQNMTPEDPININIEAAEETHHQTITIASGIFQENEEMEYILPDMSNNIMFEPLTVVKTENSEENCDDPIIANNCYNQNESFETEENAHMCLICGSNITTGNEFSVEKLIENEKWRIECAQTICELFFGLEFHSFNQFFQIAEYCTSCLTLIKEADSTRRLVMSLQKTIDKLSINLRKRFALNFVQLNISQRNKDDHPSQTKVFEFPGNLSLYEVVREIYEENRSAFDLDLPETHYVPLQNFTKSNITNSYTKANSPQSKQKHWTKELSTGTEEVGISNLEEQKRKRGRPRKKKNNIQAKENYAGNRISRPEIKVENELLTVTVGLADDYSLTNKRKRGRPRGKKIKRGGPRKNELLNSTSSEGNTNDEFLENNVVNSINKRRPGRPRKKIFDIEKNDNEDGGNISTKIVASGNFQAGYTGSQSKNFKVQGRQTYSELQTQRDLDGDVLNSEGKILRRQRKPPQRFTIENTGLSSEGQLKPPKKKIQKPKITDEWNKEYWEKRWRYQQKKQKTLNLAKRMQRYKLLNDVSEKSCPVEGCNFKYVKKITLRQHVKIEHQGIHVDETLFHCHYDGCGMKYTVNSVLEDHIMTVHEGLNDIYKCNYCPKAFGSIEMLRRHIFTHPEFKIAVDDPKHSKPIYNFTCAICEQGYLKEEDLVAHKKIHFRPNSFVCCHCNKQFTNRAELLIHIKMENFLGFSKERRRRKRGRPKKIKLNTQAKKNYAGDKISTSEIKEGKQLLTVTAGLVDDYSLTGNKRKPGRPRGKSIKPMCPRENFIYVKPNENELFRSTSSEVQNKRKPGRPRKIFNIERNDKEELVNIPTKIEISDDFQTNSQKDIFEDNRQQTSLELQTQRDLEGDVLNSEGKQVDEANFLCHVDGGWNEVHQGLGVETTKALNQDYA